MESAAALGLVMGALVFAPSGGSMQVFTDGLRILILLVPLYFLDSLMSIRFDEFGTTQLHIVCIIAVFFGLPLAGVKQQTILAALYGITSSVGQIKANVYNAAAVVSPLQSPAATPRFILIEGQSYSLTPPDGIQDTVYVNTAP